MSYARIARLAATLGVALALVVTGAVAGAAGQALLLGRSNSAGASTTSLTANLAGSVLKVTQAGLGTPLTITGPSTKAPMNVNSTRKVTNLNADSVDGRTSTDFLASATYRAVTSNAIAAGGTWTPLVSCDEGDGVLSGGWFDKTATTNVLDSIPNSGTSWSFFFQNAGAGVDNVTVFVLCSDAPPLHVTLLGTDDLPRD